MTGVLICEDDLLHAIDLADAVVTSGGQVCACVRVMSSRSCSDCVLRIDRALV